MMWCIENSIVLNSFKKEEIFIIFYEYLISDPVKSIKKLYKYLNFNFSDNYINNKWKKVIPIPLHSGIEDNDIIKLIKLLILSFLKSTKTSSIAYKPD